MNALQPKRIKDSQVEMRELVIPNDTNLIGNLLGGRLMHLVDVAGAMAASRHSNGLVATVGIDRVDFKYPIKLGELVWLKARLTWVGRTSMEVLVEVFSENYTTGKVTFANRAYISFVAIDGEGKSRPTPGLIIETDTERADYEAAAKRREERLQRKETSPSI